MNTKLKFTTFAAALALIVVPMAASAKQPHPTSTYDVTVDSCECTDTGIRLDVSELIDGEDASLLNCNVMWSSTPPAPAYGASIEFEAEWAVDELEYEAKSEAEIEEYECTGATPDACTANVDITVPDVPEGAEVEFEAQVKGFENGKDGKVSRDFVKSKGDCSLVEA